MLREDQILTDEVIDTVGLERVGDLTREVRQVGPERCRQVDRVSRLTAEVLVEFMPLFTKADMLTTCLTVGTLLGYALAWEYAGIRFGKAETPDGR